SRRRVAAQVHPERREGARHDPSQSGEREREDDDRDDAGAALPVMERDGEVDAVVPAQEDLDAVAAREVDERERETAHEARAERRREAESERAAERRDVERPVVEGGVGEAREVAQDEVGGELLQEARGDADDERFERSPPRGATIGAPDEERERDAEDAAHAEPVARDAPRSAEVGPAGAEARVAEEGERE